jgi:hypothetical protein
MEKVMKLGNSLVGWVSLAMGAGAFLSVVGLIWFANAFDYPLIVGGKPMFSEPMTFVPAYIMLIMGGAVGALVGMLALNQLPRLHHPLFANKISRSPRATNFSSPSARPTRNFPKPKPASCSKKSAARTSNSWRTKTDALHHLHAVDWRGARRGGCRHCRISGPAVAQAAH